MTINTTTAQALHEYAQRVDIDTAGTLASFIWYADQIGPAGAIVNTAADLGLYQAAEILNAIL